MLADFKMGIACGDMRSNSIFVISIGVLYCIFLLVFILDYRIIKKKIDYSDIQDAFIIIPSLSDIMSDDDFRK